MRPSLSRRRLFRGDPRSPDIRQPPWTDQHFTDHCTRCGDCVRACPEQILVKGDGGFPEIRVDNAGCSLCGDCVRVCSEPVFDTTQAAFPWRAVIGNACLALANVHCQSCQDACEPAAIRFRPQPGRAPQPQLSTDTCTGCGACVSVCPATAITLEEPA